MTGSPIDQPTGTASPRRDIQGLRALAVVAVIANHLVGFPAGGFIGVDVFFVVSGFLITGMLYREHERSGRISFTSFYRRRVRRLLPMSTLVLLATVTAGYLLYLSTQARDVLVDAGWALVFSANWHLALDGTNYWAAGDAVSPLQHFWSLAVEEQFYLIWPWLLVIVLGLRFRARVLFIVMAVVTAASLGWSLWETAHQPTWAYFDTLSRAWELGAGALLAITARRLATLADNVRPLLAWTGLTLIAVSLVVVTESHFPAPWALLPVTGTALVIAAGTGGSQRWLSPLTNRVSTYVGDISYSLYLWHLPVIILLALMVPRGPVYDLTALVLIVGLSVATYHLVESPIRQSSWLEPTKPAPWETSGPRFVLTGSGEWVPAHLVEVERRRHPGLRAGVGALALSVGLTAAVVSLPLATSAEASHPVSSVAGQQAQAAAGRAVASAVATKEFPRFDPPVESLDAKAWLDSVTSQGCLSWDAEPSETSPETLKSCDAGDPSASKRVVLLGDSYAAAWMPAVKKAYLAQHWHVQVVTKQQCPTASVSVTLVGGGAYPECDDHRRWTLEMIKQTRPDLVILADSEDTPERLADHASGAAADTEIAQGLSTTLEAIVPYAGRTVVLAPPPEGKAMQACVTRVSHPADCTTTISARWNGLATALKSASSPRPRAVHRHPPVVLHRRRSLPRIRWDDTHPGGRRPSDHHRSSSPGPRAGRGHSLSSRQSKRKKHHERATRDRNLDPHRNRHPLRHSRCSRPIPPDAQATSLTTERLEGNHDDARVRRAGHARRRRMGAELLHRAASALRPRRLGARDPARRKR